MRAIRKQKKPRLDSIQSLTIRELELLAFFRGMTDFDQRLLVRTAQNMVSPQTASGNKTN
jgi:hypothetical protein